ncbi:ABC transporter substrate-binding protein [Yinghuangia seranimata]|uniref:ABC transporter substrate-binding protein n=1 Tax=Yinghuangia seranimata TaxID=408067 RepID=UPI00248B9B1E|nr:ABC transporter substrate-binding protein [Yinghuangia seranimata]MDI2124735.1 ABC transporter substrate-binding protein [Yinghuangia seranimata]
MPFDVQTLDPIAPNFASSMDYTAARGVMDPLFDVDAQGALVPQLALGAVASDGNRTFTVQLRDGVKFSDGTDFDAAAVIAHYQEIKDKKTCLGCAPRLVGLVSAITAKDPHTVVFALSAPWAEFPEVGLTGIAGLIPSPTAKKAAGDAFGRNPVGTGAFKLAEIAPGDHVTLVRNETSWLADRTYPDKVVLKVMLDTQTAVQSVQAGTIDVMVSSQPNQAQQAKSAGLQVQLNRGLAPDGIIMNLNRPGLDDVRVRRALSMAIDRQAINKVAYNGDTQPTTAFLAEDDPEQQGIGVPGYDPDKARQLLAEYGKPVRLELNTLQGSNYIAATQLIQQQWKAVGVETTIKVNTAVGIMQDVLQRNYDTSFSPAFMATTTVDALEVAFSSTGRLNLGGYVNKQNDELFGQLGAATDSAAALPIARQILTNVSNDVPSIPVVRKTGMFAASAKVHLPAPDGYRVDAFTLTDLWLTR